MRINGQWYPCDDGFIRPVVFGEARTGDDQWVEIPFLIDSGADWTTFSPEVLPQLRSTLSKADHGLTGIGGWTETCQLTTAIRFACEGGFPASLRGTYAALTEPGSLDMSILGRDILNLFTLILDRENDVVTLINQNHQYVIVEK